MQTLLHDIRYAFRQMRLSPAFTLTAVLTLAIGIGATTAIFTLVHAIMLKSLPVADPAQLYRIGDTGSAASTAGRTMTGACSPISSISVWPLLRRSSKRRLLSRPRPAFTASAAPTETTWHGRCAPNS